MTTDTLRAILETLKRENERGAICDTIWHTPHQTLFDFIEGEIAALAAPVQEPVAWRVCVEGLWLHGATQKGLITAIEVKFGKSLTPSQVMEPLYAAPQAAPAVPDETRALIEECRAALAEELSAWDIDPPLHHVNQAHNKCVAWLAARPQAGQARQPTATPPTA